MGMGDLKIAEARGYERAHRQILDACSKAFKSDSNKANCSGFVKAVARELGIVAIGNLGAGRANDIYQELEKRPWIPLGKGRAGAVEAAYAAREGSFVVAAWKNPSGSGHVAVVTDLDLANLKIEGAVSDRNVLASWGVLDHKDLAKNGGLIRTTFNPTNKLPDVIYAWHPIMRFQ